MHDMTRAEAQDLLPDLLHGGLSDAERAAVERLIASDPDLAAELSVIRGVHAAHAASPRVDIARILAALPAAPAEERGLAALPLVRQIDDLAVRRGMTRSTRLAGFARAAAVLLVLGGGAVMATRSVRMPDAPIATSTPAESLALVADAVQLGLGVPTDDLTVEQLRALEQDIEALDGVPSEEPDVVMDLADGEGA